MYCVLVVLNLVSLIGSGLGFHGFPPPSFQSDWLEMSSEDTNTSYRVVPHGLGDVPVMAKVLVRVVGGPNKDYVFEATGAAQTDDDLPGVRSGIVYLYNNNSIFIWTATINNQYANYFSMYIGEPWGSGENAQKEKAALVQAQAWSKTDFYAPDFVSEAVVVERGSYKEIHHNLEEIPALIKVVGSFTSDGYIFEGTGMAQSGGGHGTLGGVVFAHSLDSIRLWIANSSVASAKLIFVGDIGQTNNTQASNIGEIRVRVWCGNASGTPACPEDRPKLSCPRMNHVNWITTNSTLIKLSSETSTSFVTCLRNCCDIRHCTALSRTGGVCNLYGERQFGNVSLTEDGEELFQLVYEGQSLCGGG